MIVGAPLRVVLDGGALVDGRATAGIGRYVRSLAAELTGLDGLALTVSRPGRRIRSERHPLRHLHAQPALVRAAWSLRPDVVHAPATDPAVGWPLGRQVVTVHDVIPWTSAAHGRGLASRCWFGLQAGRLRRCAAVIVPSPVVGRAVAAVVRVRPERVTVVPEGVAPVFSPEPSATDGDRRRALGLPARYVLWTGSLLAPDPRKALDVLVDAVAVAAGATADLGLVLAGRIGPAAAEVAAQARAAGLAVTFAGFVSDDDLAALHRGAAVSVVPSLDEGFGLPVLEAMACGAPIVATRAGNIPDLAGDAAILVAPGDRRALAEAITAVVDGGAADLRARGPRRAAAYTWRRTAEQTLEVYRAVAMRGRG